MGTVTVICPNLQCRKPLQVPAAVRGKVVRCRFCGSRFAVPVEGAEGRAKPAKSDGAG